MTYAENFDKIYYKKFNPAEVSSKAEYIVNLGGGFGIVKEDGKLYAFIPPRGGLDKLLARIQKGGERIDYR